MPSYNRYNDITNNFIDKRIQNYQWIYFEKKSIKYL
jgi:hypothetical protein